MRMYGWRREGVPWRYLESQKLALFRTVQFAKLSTAKQNVVCQRRAIYNCLEDKSLQLFLWSTLRVLKALGLRAARNESARDLFCIPFHDFQGGCVVRKQAKVLSV
jgi:hypothetical protein